MTYLPRALRCLLAVAAVLAVAAAGTPAAPVQAAIPPPGPSDGSIGLEGTIPSPPPTRGATITVPSNGAVFTGTPITVSGLCPTGLLVKIFSNNVFVGSVMCVNGSYSLQVDLFSGQNDLVARVYDALDQAGPDSNTVTVIFNDAQFAAFGTHVALSSVYAKRGAPPGTELTWPILLSGGTGPYALSVDWGDGTSTDLMSIANPGTIIIKHTYKTAGIYKVIVKATDKNGGTAFLQLVAQATGVIQSSTTKPEKTIIVTKLIVWPLLVMLLLIIAAFWIGRRYELLSLRKHFRSQ